MNSFSILPCLFSRIIHLVLVHYNHTVLFCSKSGEMYLSHPAVLACCLEQSGKRKKRKALYVSAVSTGVVVSAQNSFLTAMKYYKCGVCDPTTDCVGNMMHHVQIWSQTRQFSITQRMTRRITQCMTQCVTRRKTRRSMACSS